VAIDGVMLGSTTRDSFLMAELLPGTHVVASTTDENVSTVRLEAREGESYFVKLSTRMGRKVTRSALVQVDSIEGREAIARARMLQAIMP
jgi:phage-related baseplate assembly protein